MYIRHCIKYLYQHGYEVYIAKRFVKVAKGPDDKKIHASIIT
jgi:hypothetical protein